MSISSFLGTNKDPTGRRNTLPKREEGIRRQAQSSFCDDADCVQRLTRHQTETMTVPAWRKRDVTGSFFILD